jgi:hypothetical protein
VCEDVIKKIENANALGEKYSILSDKWIECITHAFLTKNEYPHEALNTYLKEKRVQAKYFKFEE